MKQHYPEAFTAALLNSQPMVFYAPAQLVRDAREHGVEVRHPDVNASDWDATLEAREEGEPRALRLGLRSIDGFRKEWGERIMEVRAERPFADLEDLRVRAKLAPGALDRLAEADAFGSLDLTRRQGLWAARGATPALSAPLFEAMGLDETDGLPPEALPRLSASEEVVGDYQTIRLSLKGHPVSFLRERLERAGAVRQPGNASSSSSSECARVDSRCASRCGIASRLSFSIPAPGNKRHAAASVSGTGAPWRNTAGSAVASTSPSGACR